MSNRLDPTNQLAIARTVLANERTLLAHFRSSLGAIIGGASLIKFFGHPVYGIGGAILMAVAVIWLVVGVRRYLATRKLISDIDPQDWRKIAQIIKADHNYRR